MSARSPVRVAPDGEIIGWIEQIEGAMLGVPYLGYRALVGPNLDGAIEVPCIFDTLSEADRAIRARWAAAHPLGDV